jgi:transcriptional regulator with XRE-family HTH domain
MLYKLPTACLYGQSRLSHGITRNYMPLRDNKRDSYAVDVGLRLQIARRAAGLTQAKLADMLDIDQMRLSNWELGKYHLPPTFALRIFQQTGINPDYLFLGIPLHLPAAIRDEILRLQREPPDLSHKPRKRKPSPK